MKFGGIPIVTSPYVPKAECSEVDYSRPLIVRLFHGRTVDFRYWEEDQIFMFSGPITIGGPTATMLPETFAVLRGLTP